MSREIIHLGDAGLGRISCANVKEKRDQYGPKNWTYTPERVTCKRCIAIYRKKVRENQ